MRALICWILDKRFVLIRSAVALQLLYFFVFCVVRKPLIDTIPGVQDWFIAEPVMGAIASVLFLVGKWTRVSALVMMAAIFTVLNALPVLKELQYPYFSIILTVYAIFLPDEKPVDVSWRLPLFLIVSLGLSISGLSKLFCTPWWNGEAVGLICAAGLWRPSFDFACHGFVPVLLTRLTLLVEISLFPLAVFRRTRGVSWLLHTGLQLGLLIFMPIAITSVAMLTFQFFLLDPDWFRGGTSAP